MIGTIAMDIDHVEMCKAIEFYLNRSVFDASVGRKYHEARVVKVSQRSNGRFVIEFESQPLPSEEGK